jgi:adenylate cyclase
MRIPFSGISRVKIRQVLWISVIWACLGALDALNTQAVTFTSFLSIPRTNVFERFFWVNTLSAFISGLVSGSVFIFFLRKQVNRLSYGFAIVVSSVVVISINFFITILGYEIFLSSYIGERVFESVFMNRADFMLRAPFYLKNMVFWMLIVLLTIWTINVNEKYGPGVLFKLIMGRYHRPREETRIFMFVDIKSSTMIAEKLGHIRFFELINDFFHDITNPILNASGEIYQYVGDEVVISWSLEKGTRNSNCIRCFYSMREAVQKQSKRYKENYGFVPEFKAGLHYGVVTVGEIGVIKRDIIYSGDVLNTASRIQAMCNKFRVKILLSKHLLDQLNLPPHEYSSKRMGNIELKGKKKKVELYTFEKSLDAQLEFPPADTV